MALAWLPPALIRRPVWDASSGRELLTLTHHTALVRNIVFSPKGTHLATASDDGTVRVYTLNIEDLMALCARA